MRKSHGKIGRLVTGSGTANWVSAIDAVPLEHVTSDKIRAWKKWSVDQAGRDEVLRRLKFDTRISPRLSGARDGKPSGTNTTP